jgi:hypothetical protein
MSLERWIRLLAGSLVILSLALAQFHSRYWLLLTLFVGLNLFQSALTGFCPAEKVLKRFGVGRAQSGETLQAARA